MHTLTYRSSLFQFYVRTYTCERCSYEFPVLSRRTTLEYREFNPKSASFYLSTNLFVAIAYDSIIETLSIDKTKDVILLSYNNDE